MDAYYERGCLQRGTWRRAALILHVRGLTVQRSATVDELKPRRLAAKAALAERCVRVVGPSKRLSYTAKRPRGVACGGCVRIVESGPDRYGAS